MTKQERLHLSHPSVHPGATTIILLLNIKYCYNWRLEGLGNDSDAFGYVSHSLVELPGVTCLCTF